MKNTIKGWEGGGEVGSGKIASEKSAGVKLHKKKEK